MTPSVTYQKKQPAVRLLSLDALRGFDMFWIVCGEFIFHGLAKAVQQQHGLVKDAHTWQITTNDSLKVWEQLVIAISNQLHHSVWNGFTFYDLIFPLFIFIAGVSMPFSYAKYLERSDAVPALSRKRIYFLLLRRTLLLVLLGMVANGLFQWKGYEQTRFASVLGKIGLSCFFAALIYLNTKLRGRITWLVEKTTGYWLLLKLFPVPGFGPGNLTPEGNITAWFDRLFLPGKLHRGIYDPEGILSTIPSVATALLGVFTGELLRAGRFTPVKKVVLMVLAGLVLITLGRIWNEVLPINKIIWSGSFVVYAGGWSLLLLSFFYLVIDVWGQKKWSMPWVWMGTNSILIYMAVHGVVDFEATSSFFFGGVLKHVAKPYYEAGLWTGVMLVQFALLYFLFRKKWFLKL